MKHRIFFKRFGILILLFFFLDFILSVLLLNGLNKYYGFDKHPDILVNGSSMSISGFNRTEIERSTGMRVASYSHEGVSVTDRNAMIKHFFHMYPEGIKTVIYEINPILLSDVSSAKNVYTLFYPNMDDKAIDMYIKERAGTREYITHKIVRTTRFDGRLIPTIAMGYLGKYENLKTNTMDTVPLLPLLTKQGLTEIRLEKNNIEVFENTMDLIISKNSDIILVMMPMYYMKLNTFRSSDYNALCKYLEEFSTSREGISFINLNKDSLTHNAGFFSDQLHFNVYGQRLITDIISSQLLKTRSNYK